MAATSVSFTPIATYLDEAYHPDVDYVDGVLEDRNVGEFDHARVQRALLFALTKEEDRLGYFVLQELRVQISSTRYRVPDTCLLSSDHLPTRVVTRPPLLCIEVLSPEDRFAAVRDKCHDYLNFGVPEVWIFDPESRVVYALQGEATTEYRSGSLKLESVGLKLDLNEVFSILDAK